MMLATSSVALSAHSEHARLERELEELSLEILERYEEVNILYRLSDAFKDVFEEGEILRQLLDEATRAVRSERGWIAIAAPEDESAGSAPSARVGSVGPIAVEGLAAEAPVPKVLRWMKSASPDPAEPPPAVITLAFRAILENRALSIESDERDVSTGAFDRTGGPLMAVPLPGESTSIGCLVLEKDRTAEPFRSGDLRLAGAVAAMGASIVQNRRLAREMKETERVKGEIEIARRIQQGLLPSNDPAIAGLQVAGLCRPAQDIGGDYFGYSNIAPGQLGIIIADVSGHSVGAAIGMVMARCLIQSEAHQSASPSKIASRVNDLLNRDLTDPGMFVTAFLAVYEEKTARFHYTNAGHNPPLLYRAANGSISPLRGGSLGLGILPGTRYFDRVDSLQSNDMLVMYTDGLTEARSPQGEMFGADRLKKAIVACSALDARGAVDALLAHVTDWHGGSEFIDDVTLVVARKE